MSTKDKVEDYKRVMANYPTGVTVITALDKEDNPIGLTVNSFTSVSLDPLLVLWSIDKKTTSYSEFTRVNKFAIHILSSNQIDLCTLFSSKGINRFANCDWKFSKYKLPVLKNTCSVLQCRTFNKVEAGDHLVIFGEVLSIDNSNRSPMLYHNRKFVNLPI